MTCRFFSIAFLRRKRMSRGRSKARGHLNVILKKNKTRFKRLTAVKTREKRLKIFTLVTRKAIPSRALLQTVCSSLVIHNDALLIGWISWFKSSLAGRWFAVTFVIRAPDWSNTSVLNAVLFVHFLFLLRLLSILWNLAFYLKKKNVLKTEIYTGFNCKHYNVKRLL